MTDWGWTMLSMVLPLYIFGGDFIKLPFFNFGKKIEDTTKELTKTATDQVKKEIKKTALDLLPGILTIGTMILGFVLFHKADDGDGSIGSRPYKSITHSTTYNYFFDGVGEDMIKKILEVNDDEE